MVQTFEIKIGEKKYICKIYYQILDEFLARGVQLKKVEDIIEKERLTKEMRIYLITKMTLNPKLDKAHLDSEEATLDDHELGFRLVEYLGEQVEKRYAMVKKKDMPLQDSGLNPPKIILPKKNQS